MTKLDGLAPVKPASVPAMLPAELSIEELVARSQKVQAAMKAVMHDGEHYGVIPGTGTKPTLLKPGAEKLLNLFMLDPEYDIQPLRDGDHLTMTSTCTLFHIPTGARVGSGMGLCSTRESKYAYRHGKRTCPACGSEQIRRSKFPPRNKPTEAPGWYCYAKAGGCGATFAAGDPAIVDQVIGRIDNPDKADQYNTVLKMANKRSLIAAVLNVTGASDLFTQDLEDEAGDDDPEPKAPAEDDPRLAETKAERMRSRNSEGERLERNALLGKIKAAADLKGMPEAKRRELWTAHCGTATQETVSLEALGELLGAVHTWTTTTREPDARG